MEALLFSDKKSPKMMHSTRYITADISEISMVTPKYFHTKRLAISHSMIAHGIDPFPVIHRKFTFSLLKRLSDSENPVLNVLCSWVGYFNSSMYKAWSNTLFLGDKTNTNFGN